MLRAGCENPALGLAGLSSRAEPGHSICLILVLVLQEQRSPEPCLECDKAVIACFRFLVGLHSMCLCSHRVITISALWKSLEDLKGEPQEREKRDWRPLTPRRSKRWRVVSLCLYRMPRCPLGQPATGWNAVPPPRSFPELSSCNWEYPELSQAAGKVFSFRTGSGKGPLGAGVSQFEEVLGSGELGVGCGHWLAGAQYCRKAISGNEPSRN